MVKAAREGPKFEGSEAQASIALGAYHLSLQGTTMGADTCLGGRMK